jgi:uncharacterized protein YhfF
VGCEARKLLKNMAKKKTKEVAEELAEEIVKETKKASTPVVTIYEQNGLPYKKVTTLNGEVVSIERL